LTVVARQASVRFGHPAGCHELLLIRRNLGDQKAAVDYGQRPGHYGLAKTPIVDLQSRPSPAEKQHDFRLEFIVPLVRQITKDDAGAEGAAWTWGFAKSRRSPQSGRGTFAEPSAPASSAASQVGAQ